MAPSTPTRRQILAGLGGIGAVGAIGGASTYAFFNARAALDGTVRAGQISVNVDCEGCHAPGDGVEFVFEGIDRGDTGTGTLDVTVDTNPARLWLRTDCPPAFDALGDALMVTLRDGAGEVLASGTLSDVRRKLNTGVRLDDRNGDDCTVPGEPVALALEWELPNDTDDSVAGSTTSLRFEFFAEQCRHVDEAAVIDPFIGSAPCKEADCPACELLGKFEFADDEDQLFEVGETYPLDNADGVSGDYRLRVTDVEDNGDDETTCVAFELERTDGSTPPMCRVDVGSGRSCNPGSSDGGSPNAKKYEFEPPRYATGAALCTRTFGEIAEECGDDGRGPHVGGPPADATPAISNVAVYVCVDDETSAEPSDEHVNTGDNE